MLHHLIDLEYKWVRLKHRYGDSIQASGKYSSDIHNNIICHFSMLPYFQQVYGCLRHQGLSFQTRFRATAAKVLYILFVTHTTVLYRSMRLHKSTLASSAA